MSPARPETGSRRKGAPARRRGWRLWRGLLLAIGAAYLAGLALDRCGGPRFTAGTNVCTPPLPLAAGEARFLFDLTGTAPDGRRVFHQETFDALLELIARATDGELLLLDQFLVNHFRGRTGTGGSPHRDLTGELVQALLAARRHHPGLAILFITDPLNANYADQCPPDLQPLAEAGIPVLLTPHELLADSNHLYSPFHRLLAWPASRLPGSDRPLLANPFDPDQPRLGLRAFARLLNFKANHRKVAVRLAPDGSGEALVSSANPHTASSAHGNCALHLTAGPVAAAILRSELQLAHTILLHRPHLAFGTPAKLALQRDLAARLAALPATTPTAAAEPGRPTAQFATEAAFATQLEAELARAGAGDQIAILQFYLADPRLLRALKDACARGATVRLLLDLNRDAFGRAKNGIPNRATAHSLHAWATRTGHDLQIRWFRTAGEQAHAKAMLIRRPATGHSVLAAGSANWTVRNLRGSNLEAGLILRDVPAAAERYTTAFTQLWENPEATAYSVAYSEPDAPGAAGRLGQRLLTAFGSFTGACTY
ncbi:MAG: phospholipase D-like domain-containing protein [Lentisphaeria bacterium]|jgi:hypothetical protein